MTDFGVHVVSSTSCDLYLNGVKGGSYTHDPFTGGFLLMSAHANGLPHVDRLEVRAAPGGTLLLSDDFVNLAGWSLGHHGVNWTVSPAGFAYGSVNSGSGYGIYRTFPAGSTYFELKGVTFDGSGDPDGWVMLTPHRQTAISQSDGASPVDGYRVLLRPNGSVELVNGNLVSLGWSVGSVAIG